MAGTAEKSKNQVPTDRTEKGAHQPIVLKSSNEATPSIAINENEQIRV